MIRYRIFMKVPTPREKLTKGKCCHGHSSLKLIFAPESYTRKGDRRKKGYEEMGKSEKEMRKGEGRRL